MAPPKIDDAVSFSADGPKKRVVLVGKKGFEMRVGKRDAHRLMMVCLVIDPRWEMLPADWRGYFVRKSPMTPEEAKVTWKAAFIGGRLKDADPKNEHDWASVALGFFLGLGFKGPEAGELMAWAYKEGLL